MLLARADTPPKPTPADAAWTLDRMYRDHAAQVARWAAHLGGPRVDIDDLVHEVFVVARRRLGDFDGRAKASTWLYGITDRVTRAARRKARVRAFLDRVRRADVEAVLSPPHPTPVEELELRRDRELVYRVLDRLPEKYRRVLILFELEELSGEEVADLTGTKLATVWVHRHRARGLFQAELERQTGEGGTP